MNTTSLGFASSDGETKIHVLLWQPDAKTIAPRGIIQIVHGMSEYIERYEPFAEFLTEQGFVVCANDHVGHGQSVAEDGMLGHIPMKRGADILLDDVHALRTMVAGRFSRQTPYVLFGHSMGSFIARAYIGDAERVRGLAAAVLCGTGQQAVALSKAGNVLARLLGGVRGERYQSSLIHGMADGAYSKAISDARTDFDWLSTDESVVDAYIADSACGQLFTCGGYAALTSLTGEVAGKAHAIRVPKDLPLLFIAGQEDPVGECGEGVKRAAEMYRGVGVQHVDVKLYEGMRHEILNEPDRRHVYQDVVAWLAEQGI